METYQGLDLCLTLIKQFEMIVSIYVVWCMLYVMWCLIHDIHYAINAVFILVLHVLMWGSQETTQNPDRKTASESLAGISESQKTRNQNKNTCQQQKKEGICMSILSSPKRANHQLPQLTKLFKGSPFNKISRWRVLTVRRPKRTSVQSNISSPSSNATYGATAPLLVGWCLRGKPEETEETGVFPWSPYLTTFWRLYVPEILQVQGPVEIHMEPLMSCLRWNMPLSSQRTWAIHLV